MNKQSATVLGGYDKGVAAVVDAQTTLESPDLISESPEYMDLSKDIMREIIAGGTGSSYKQEIADLSPADRLTLATEIYAIATEYNQLRGLTPYADRDALVVDGAAGVNRDNEDYLQYLVIQRGFYSEEYPEQLLETLHLYLSRHY